MILGFEKVTDAEPTSIPAIRRTKVVAASLCRGAAVLLRPPARRHSALATALHIRRIRSKALFAVALAGALGGITPNSASATTINLNPSKDNTLYQYVDTDLSNGAGNHFFAGKTGQDYIRRAVLAFDIAGSIPPGSTISNVSLSMHLSRGGSNGTPTIELHKLIAGWGEGTSIASGQEGQGAPATKNDATWRHRFYDTTFWLAQGGDFAATVSASQSVGALGTYIWSSAQMIT